MLYAHVAKHFYIHSFAHVSSLLLQGEPRRYVQLDTRHVVLYNPALSKKYDTHINVEKSSTVVAVKYLLMFVFKGYDKVQLEFRRMQPDGPGDEVASYLQGRYVAADEACWHTFDFPRAVRRAPYVAPAERTAHRLRRGCG